MKVHVSVLAVALLGVAPPTTNARQHERHQAGVAPTARITQCVQVQPVVAGLLEAAQKRLEDARLTNNAASLRDAVEDVQSVLVDVRTQLAVCNQIEAAASDSHAGHVTPVAPPPGQAAPVHAH